MTKSDKIMPFQRRHIGVRCFSIAGPTLWNSLPEQLRQPDITFGRFKRSLKTFMFGYLGRGALCLNVKGVDKKSSYLLTYLLTHLQPLHHLAFRASCRSGCMRTVPGSLKLSRFIPTGVDYHILGAMLEA